MLLRNDDEERRPLNAVANAPMASRLQRARDGLRRLVRGEVDAAANDGRPPDGLLQLFAQMTSPPPGTGADLGAAAVNADADNNGAPNNAAALPDGVPRGDIQAAARWVEDASPFVMLLLVVFLYRHLLSILIFFWLTSLLHHANERMRKQTLLKENRSRRALVSVAALLVAQVGCIALLQGEKLPLQLQLRQAVDLSAEPPALSTLMWDVIQADLCARALLLLIKVAVALIAPASFARRLRRVYAAIEAIGLCYRISIPTPLWFHWLFHAAEDATHSPSLWSVGCSHLYIGFKLVSLIDRLRRAGIAARAVLFFHLPVGKYATQEELLELGEDGCTICQEEHTAPVKLECGHIFCEECITSWCERNTAATCPLCRAPISTLLGQHSDGTTTLLPQVF